MSEQRWVIYVCPECGATPKAGHCRAHDVDGKWAPSEGRPQMLLVEAVPASLLEERDRELVDAREHARILASESHLLEDALVRSENQREVLRAQLTEAREALEYITGKDIGGWPAHLPAKKAALRGLEGSNRCVTHLTDTAESIL